METKEAWAFAPVVRGALHCRPGKQRLEPEGAQRVHIIRILSLLPLTATLIKQSYTGTLIFNTMNAFSHMNKTVIKWDYYFMMRANTAQNGMLITAKGLTLET